jgi:type II secretory ATPase GspE/PulE/Tfp pilus assembly ATPase PilB-like protein
MDYDDTIKDMLIKGKTAFEVEKEALLQGMIDLERDGIFKVMQGIIPLGEVYRVVTHRN